MKQRLAKKAEASRLCSAALRCNVVATMGQKPPGRVLPDAPVGSVDDVRVAFLIVMLGDQLAVEATRLEKRGGGRREGREGPWMLGGP